MIKDSITTSRFILRPIELGDLSGMFELDNSSLVHTYLQDQIVTTLDQVVQVIEFIQNQYIENGIGRWAIIDKQTNEFIGWAGLKLVTEQTNGHINFYDLGYRLIPKYWGKGIASEVSLQWVNYAFNQLDIQNLYAMADSNNIASCRVLEKTGFRCSEQFYLDEVLHNWYVLTKI